MCHIARVWAFENAFPMEILSLACTMPGYVTWKESHNCTTNQYFVVLNHAISSSLSKVRKIHHFCLLDSLQFQLHCSMIKSLQFRFRWPTSYPVSPFCLLTRDFPIIVFSGSHGNEHMPHKAVFTPKVLCNWIVNPKAPTCKQLPPLFRTHFVCFIRKRRFKLTRLWACWSFLGRK